MAGMSADQRETVERVSDLVLRLADGNLQRLIEGYRWMCEMVLEEELHFRRTGAYRYSRFEEVRDRVYFDDVVMTKYMDGLLLSQVLWANHITVLDNYIRSFVSKSRAGVRHLEVGPGHGLLLYLAASVPDIRLTGWDVSTTSLDRTRDALSRLRAGREVALLLQSVFEVTPGMKYDSVVISEVLEHLEQPKQALVGLRDCMTAGARIYVNAPVNSPAVDHIYLFRTPDELVELVRDSGFKVESTCFAPSTGYTEARARKHKTSISCAVIATKGA
jgi:hypothetical protein